MEADPLLHVLLAGLAFGGAFLSGLVGVGGAVVMIPLLLYVPPFAGLAPLGIKTVAGITMVQVFASSLVGILGHRERIHRPLALALGPGMVVASFAGGIASAAVEPIVLEVVFATMAAVAAAIMLVLRHRTAPEGDGPVAFNAPLALVVGLLVGFAAGLVGAGGAFFLIPVMLYVLRIPVRATVGTSLVVVAASATAGMAGKVLGGQVDWSLAAALVAGALPGARLGAIVSKRTSTDRLVAVLGIAIAIVSARMWADILG